MSHPEVVEAYVGVDTDSPPGVAAASGEVDRA
jgi:hypothetical protein